MKNYIISLFIFTITFLIFFAHCKWESEIEARISERVPQGFILSSSEVGATGRQQGQFNYDGQIVTCTATVTVEGEVNGEPYSETMTVEISMSGCEGAYYELDCSDPIVIQFPPDATNFVGTFQGNSLSGQLIIESGLKSIPITPDNNMFAENDNQLIIIGYPEILEPGSYDFSLSFDLDSSRIIEIKPIVTAKVLYDSSTFFPPFLPGVTSFVDIPPVILPVSDSLMQVEFPLENLKIQDVHIDFCEGNEVNDQEQTYKIPDNFAVLQNYPNPFNSITNIQYNLSENRRVILSIYNILGIEIKRLLDKEQQAGYFTANWDAKDVNDKDVSSGIYLYRIQAGDFIDIKKMLLIR